MAKMFNRARIIFNITLVKIIMMRDSFLQHSEVKHVIVILERLGVCQILLDEKFRHIKITLAYQNKSWLF